MHRSLALVLSMVVASGCDAVLDHVRENLRRGVGGGGTGAGPAPAPTPPVAPPGKPCASTTECAKGELCTTERGVCNAPPGCGGPNVSCPAVCYGTCEPPGKPLPPPPPPPPPPAKCDDIALVGDETTCRSPEEWKVLVHDLCLKQGKVLADFSAGGGDCGQGGTRMAKYQCCVSAPPPPPPVTPPPPIDPPPPPGRCEGASEGGPTSCKPPEVWKKYAADNCAAKGMALTDIGYAEDCGEGSFRFMKYLCCAPK